MHACMFGSLTIASPCQPPSGVCSAAAVSSVFERGQSAVGGPLHWLEASLRVRLEEPERAATDLRLGNATAAAARGRQPLQRAGCQGRSWLLLCPEADESHQRLQAVRMRCKKPHAERQLRRGLLRFLQQQQQL